MSGARRIHLLLGMLCWAACLLTQPVQAQTLDHYTLIMSWLPGRCLVTPDLPACEGLTLKQPAGRNLTLLGLRPDPRTGSVPMRDCDPTTSAFSTPLFAGEGDGKGMEACQLPIVKLSDPLSQALAAVMPTTAQCAERRFWASYGSCSLLSQERYFQRAVDKAEEMQKSLLNMTIAGAIGTRIKQQALFDAFTRQFGDDGLAALQLVCGRAKERPIPVLTEIRVTLRQQGTMHSLTKEGLWSERGAIPRQRCPESFLIAEAGQPVPDPVQKPSPPGTIEIPQMPQIPAPEVPEVTQPKVVVPEITAPAKPDPTKPQPMDTEPMEIIPPQIPANVPKGTVQP